MIKELQFLMNITLKMRSIIFLAKGSPEVKHFLIVHNFTCFLPVSLSCVSEILALKDPSQAGTVSVM